MMTKTMRVITDPEWMARMKEYERLRDQSHRSGLSISQQVLKNNLIQYLGALNQHHNREITEQASKLNKMLNQLGRQRKKQ